MIRTMLGLFCFLALFSVRPAHAQTGKDGETQFDCIGSATCGPFNVTVTSSVDTMMCYRIAIVDANQVAYVVSATRNAQAASKIVSSPSGTAFYNPGAGNTASRVEIYCRLAPTVGTFTATVVLNAIPSVEAVIDVLTATRVTQSLVTDGLTGATENVPSGGSGPPQPSCALTTSGRFDFVLDVSLNNAGTTNPSAVSPSLKQFASGTNFTGFGSTQVVPTAASVTLAWNGAYSAWTQACAAFTWDGTQAPPTQYYLDTLANGASDTNSGLSPLAPWLSPNHAVNGGDVLNMAAGVLYDYNNYRVGQWGPVSSFAGDIAWVKGAANFASEIVISATGYNAVAPSSSYWGVQGLHVHVTTFGTNICFQSTPAGAAPSIYTVFANNIADGCGDDGLNGFHTDYLAIIGNIAYNAAQDNANCYSGIHIVSPTAYDSLPGTHLYVAGNFLWSNVDPSPCGGVQATDGQGLSLDSLANSPYTGQILVDNNISVFNGATCFQNFDSFVAPVYVRHNTCYGNQTGSVNANPCGEINVELANMTQVFLNLVQPAASTGCSTSGSSRNIYALSSSSDDKTDVFFSNYLYSSGGFNTTGTNSVFTGNTTGTNPNFANPVEPSAPSCSSFASVPACMATVIANFTPSTQAAKAYGYQKPSSTPVYDPLFPQWLITVSNLPPGLITMGTLTGSGSGLGPGARMTPGSSLY